MFTTSISYHIFYSVPPHQPKLELKNFLFVDIINTIYIYLHLVTPNDMYESYTDILCLILSCPEFRQKVERQEVVTHTHYKTEDYWGLLVSSGGSGYENAMEKYVYGKLNKVLLYILAIFLVYVMIFQSGACARSAEIWKNHQICQKIMRQKLEKSPSLVQLALKPFFGWLRVPANPISGKRLVTTTAIYF